MSANIIVLQDVSLIRGGVEILKNISLGVPAGKTTVILGPAGCGKSSLLKVMAGLLSPGKGKVLFDGRDYSGFKDPELTALRKRTGFVFQDGALWANRSVYENLAIPLQLHNSGISNEELNERINGLIHEVGYWDNIQLRPAQISAGERKLISFARGICNDPEILFLDFPTSGVDTINARKLDSIMKKYREQNRTIILTTHDSATLSNYTDYLITLDKGEVICDGSFPEILSSGNKRLEEILSDVIAKAKDESEGDDLLDLMNGGG